MTQNIEEPSPVRLRREVSRALDAGAETALQSATAATWVATGTILLMGALTAGIGKLTKWCSPGAGFVLGALSGAFTVAMKQWENNRQDAMLKSRGLAGNDRKMYKMIAHNKWTGQQIPDFDRAGRAHLDAADEAELNPTAKSGHQERLNARQVGQQEIER